jgi:hypothetical protein
MVDTLGNPRFKGGGSLWKSSWKRQVPYTEMCWFLGFNDSLFGQWYEDPGGVLPLVPGDGFWLGAVVGVVAPPNLGTVEFIARNGAVSAEGWDLIMTNPGPTPAGIPTVGFTFRVWDGAVVAASAPSGAFEISLDPQLGVTQRLLRVFAWFLPPPDGGAFGSINISVESVPAIGGPFPLASAYLNSTPLLTLGKGDVLGSTLSAPNCLHGLVGGDGVKLGDDADMRVTAAAWAAQVHAEYQIVVPSTEPVASLAPIAGWRANDPALGVGTAPNPLAPFVGSTDLVFGNPAPLATPLSVACSQPSVFVANGV